MTAFSDSAQPAALRMALACEFTAVRQTAQAVRRFLAAQGCSENELMDCELALTEACNNAIEYAEGDARQKPVIIEALCGERAIELRVTDHTAGFEWPTEATLPEAESERGRGLYLIRSLMDQAGYFRSSGENTLVLCKHRILPEGFQSCTSPGSS